MCATYLCVFGVSVSFDSAFSSTEGVLLHVTHFQVFRKIYPLKNYRIICLLLAYMKTEPFHLVKSICAHYKGCEVGARIEELCSKCFTT